MDRKILSGSVKQVTDEGRGLAVIATLGVVDKDGDQVEPGAFGEGQVAKLLPAHDWRSVPLGKAAIREDGDRAVADFQLNLAIPAARDWHAALKFDLTNGRPLQEWSYGFLVEESGYGDVDGHPVRYLRKLKVYEISPVVVGAGEGTGTLMIKADGEKRAVSAHSTGTDERAWDGPANERRVKIGQSAAYYKRIYAWQDPEGEVGLKKTWKFIHHFIDEDGNPGSASTRACVTGIAVLNGARGGTTIPEADRAGVHRHLAKHMMDAEMEVPELRSYDECATKLADQITFAAWDAEAAAKRAIEVRALRGEEGRGLSEDRLKDLHKLERALDALKRATDAVVQSIGSAPPGDEMGMLLAQFEAVQARFHGVLSRGA